MAAPPPAYQEGAEAAERWARAAVEQLVAVDVAHGATAAVPVVRDTLRAAPYPWPELRRPGGTDLLSALAELYEVAGWILFDAGHYRQAHRMNARALALAGRSGDHWTARFVLLNHSMLAAHTGRPRAALEAASRVRGRRPLPARVAGIVLIRQAHALALLGGHARPLELIARAQNRFLDGVSRHDPPWAWWMDQTELLGHRGWVEARLRRWDRAIPLLYEAATAPGPAYRHLFTAELLSALTRAGAWREAEALIGRIAPGAAAIGSVRTTETLARTAAELRGHPDAPPAARDAAVFLHRSLPPRPLLRPR
ncbi:DNA-binding protein [Streptomyces sp. RerS4]|uniref:DNA-binding protein n=1 Tax=Streptomyces sp. RerS4 TaxID=2942449 RepID=UPI00201C5A93|nr:DNA-binding protein [Streptomyces sp. RerS4]UQX03829.1 DNA-binding protein [Streptomyces sp. RerS4]